MEVGNSFWSCAMLPQTCALDLHLTIMPSQPPSSSAHRCSTSCLLDAWFTLGFLLYQNPGMARGSMFQINTSGGIGQTDLDWVEQPVPLLPKPPSRSGIGFVFLFYFIYFSFWISVCNVHSILPCL